MARLNLDEIREDMRHLRDYGESSGGLRASKVALQLADEVEMLRAIISDQAAPQKRQVVLLMLSRGVVGLRLDSRCPGVVLPTSFANQHSVTLHIGYSMPKPIPDLVVDEFGIAGTLSFGGSPSWCFVPWHALYLAVVLGEPAGMVWGVSVPPEVSGDPPAPPDGPGGGKKEPEIEVVEGGDAPTPPKRGHLRLVD